MNQTLFITGMSCQHCKRHVTEALKSLEGVNEVEVSLPENKAVIKVDRALSFDTLKASIEEVGYTLTKVEDQRGE